MKYIITNCNCCYLSACCAPNADRLYCKDITNCLLKRIVELCKNARNERDLAFLKTKLTGADIAKLYGKADLTTEILALLEIEEVDEK